MATIASASEVETQLFDWLAELGPERDEIHRGATLEDLEIDSLDLVEISQLVEEKYGVKLGAEDVKDLSTVGDAVDLVVSKLG